jgi:hypothetical protein
VTQSSFLQAPAQQQLDRRGPARAGEDQRPRLDVSPSEPSTLQSIHPLTRACALEHVFEKMCQTLLSFSSCAMFSVNTISLICFANGVPSVEVTPVSLCLEKNFRFLCRLGSITLPRREKLHVKLCCFACDASTAISPWHYSCCPYGKDGLDFAQVVLLCLRCSLCVFSMTLKILSIQEGRPGFCLVSNPECRWSLQVPARQLSDGARAAGSDSGASAGGTVSPTKQRAFLSRLSSPESASLSSGYVPALLFSHEVWIPLSMMSR